MGQKNRENIKLSIKFFHFCQIEASFSLVQFKQVLFRQIKGRYFSSRPTKADLFLVKSNQIKTLEGKNLSNYSGSYEKFFLRKSGFFYLSNSSYSFLVKSKTIEQKIEYFMKLRVN